MGSRYPDACEIHGNMPRHNALALPGTTSQLICALYAPHFLMNMRTTLTFGPFCPLFRVFAPVCRAYFAKN